MRVMQIPPFPRKIAISDIHKVARSRLSQTIVMWPEQSIFLLGYMCWPNSPEARDATMRTLRSWGEVSEGDPLAGLPRLNRIQHRWLRIADVLHLHFDLTAGQHQRRRGGPSIGKAITLATAITRTRGTSAATFWKLWSIYKDVAPLVAAAALVCAEARSRYSEKPFGPFGLGYDQLTPFQMVMLMPDLVLAVALGFERVGLATVPRNCT